MSSLKSFYIFTGKGGVGKTTLALSFCEYLKSLDKDYTYVYFGHNKIEDKTKQQFKKDKARNSSDNVHALDLKECARGYIAKKLKSETIANWIIKTPFFSSLVNMVPGFSYVIYLGQILEILVSNPEKIIVLDSPSSGHALTMLESTKNFNEIFQDGIIYHDTKLMLDTMKKPGFTKLNIITLPTQLAINESNELKEKILLLENYQVDIICNNSLAPLLQDSLPLALKKKISNEIQAYENNAESISAQIPYSTKLTNSEIVKDLVPSLKSLV